MSKRRVCKTVVLSEVNHEIFLFACDSICGADEYWEFFCECGREGCHEYVELTADTYAALRGDGDAVLALGHRLSRSECAHRQARRSAPLAAHAKQQVTHGEEAALR